MTREVESTVAGLIGRKRDGGSLAATHLHWLMRGCADGSVSDAQLGAFAMAVHLRGMSRDETTSLALAMVDSGRRLDWRGLDLHGPLLDKHSTGGVGDPVSLLLAPMLAACGAHVPMLSGRGLGHTGGTLDKLESIPGYDCQPTLPRFQRVVAEVGCAIIGASAELAPADRRLYAIRDQTATVASVPLITASILSKKFAAGLDGLVLDVKTGNGALMDDRRDARRLAGELVAVAASTGLRCQALLTDMSQPLAGSAGNAVELQEVLACLRGDAVSPRLLAVTLALGGRLLQLAGLAADADEAEGRLRGVLDSGAAAERLAAMVHALGGPADLLDRPWACLPRAPVVRPVIAERGGWLRAVDVRALGDLVARLGGGRVVAGRAIDHAVGLSGICALGTTILPGQPLADLHARNEHDWQHAADALRAAMTLGDGPRPAPALVSALLGSPGTVSDVDSVTARASTATARAAGATA